MIYDVIVKNTNGGIICHSPNATLESAIITRNALINRFTWENEWRDNYADTITVMAIDPEAGARVELKDLQVSFA